MYLNTSYKKEHAVSKCLSLIIPVFRSWHSDFTLCVSFSLVLFPWIFSAVLQKCIWAYLDSSSLEHRWGHITWQVHVQLIKDFHTINNNPDVMWWLEMILFLPDDKHCHCTLLKFCFSFILLNNLIKDKTLWESVIFSCNCNIWRYIVKHGGPTYLAFLLTLFYLMCCFASVFRLQSFVFVSGDLQWKLGAEFWVAIFNVCETGLNWTY